MTQLTSMNQLPAEEVPASLSKEFLASRGKCCGNKCKNCPYNPKWMKGTKDLTLC
jgi:hypothetical protein